MTRVIFLLLFCFYSLISPKASCSQNTKNNQKLEEAASIVLGCENEGVSLALVYLSTHRHPKPEGIQAHSKSRTFLLQSLDQLQGMVKITDSAQALNYARFRTCLELTHAWNSDQEIVEVLSREQIGNLPDYDIKGYSRYLQSEEIQKQTSGLKGILSRTAFQQGGFEPPAVHITHDGYKIVRWLFMRNGANRKYSIQKVSEQVGKGGSYKMRVLKQASLLSLPETTWSIPALR